MSEITPTEIFTFISEVFSNEGSLELQTALSIIMETNKGGIDPKEIVRSYGVVVELYQRFCLELIQRNMSDIRNNSIRQLHDASIVAQGGT
jgi:hypothetical protein